MAHPLSGSVLEPRAAVTKDARTQDLPGSIFPRLGAAYGHNDKYGQLHLRGSLTPMNCGFNCTTRTPGKRQLPGSKTGSAAQRAM